MSEQQIASNGDASESGVFSEALTLGAVAAAGVGAIVGGKAGMKGIKHLASDAGRDSTRKALTKVTRGMQKGANSGTSTVKNLGKNVIGGMADTYKDMLVGSKMKRSEKILKNGGRPDVIFAGPAPHTDPVKL